MEELIDRLTDVYEKQERQNKGEDYEPHPA
jgi:hypothetical protein